MSISLLILLTCMQFFFAGIMLIIAVESIASKEKILSIIRDIILFLIFIVPGIINASEVIVRW